SRAAAADPSSRRPVSCSRRVSLGMTRNCPRSGPEPSGGQTSGQESLCNARLPSATAGAELVGLGKVGAGVDAVAPDGGVGLDAVDQGAEVVFVRRVAGLADVDVVELPARVGDAAGGDGGALADVDEALGGAVQGAVEADGRAGAGRQRLERAVVVEVDRD